ncbi:sensor domain-containing diguanylate cyclase [Seleniivibrio sp.]|uniref:sensor domain-containing diguanylate cyclase n=1 Tax=Seleniivibrio sp. TaxID=2898801 RepID=UPI0025D2B4C1|nr:sensor domain-containing diguanylate cyclase [Seleniivibrio sp.]MCD8554991.1 diguanylate cyclase [Seleniivibrio sp.]
MKAGGATPKNNTGFSVSENDILLLRSLMNDPDGVVIFALDRDYRYTSFSLSHKNAMKAIWNCDIELGACMLDYIQRPNEKECAKNNFDRALSGESFTEIEIYGGKFWEDRYQPVYDNGNIAGVTVLVIDVTRLVQAEEELRREMYEMERLKERELIFNSIGEGLYGVDLQGNCTFINHEALSILGYEEHEVIGRETHALFHHHHEDGSVYERSDCIIHRSLSKNTRAEETTWLFKKNGEKFPVRAIATPIKDGENVSGVVIAFCDMTSKHEVEVQLKNANKVLKMLATTDPLTGLFNRRYFEEKGAQLIAKSRKDGSELSAAMFDIDFFKKINDRYGHSIGDKVLVMVAATVTKHLRKDDIFARIGGEEFVILLPNANLRDAVDMTL